MTLKNLLLLIIALLVSACATPKIDLSETKPVIENFSMGLSSEEKSLIGENYKDSNWGLALSGGGIRSAMFQIGVLKALYDNKKLENIDLMSAVSGGSYAAYWIYSNQYYGLVKNSSSQVEYNNDKIRFGKYSLADHVFAEAACDLYTTSNFISYPKLLWNWAFVKGMNPVTYYEQQIKRTFSKPDFLADAENTLKLGDLESMIQNGSPYIIINSTVVGPDKDEEWRSRLFEMTPIHLGNDYVNYHSWDSSGNMSFFRASAISGAAWAPLLKQSIPAANSIPYGKNIFLSDGGHSENLGAVSLIKRGIENIIISDAEMDPEFSYEGLTILMKQLKDLEYRAFEIKTDGRVEMTSPEKVVFSSDDFSEATKGFRKFQLVKEGQTINLFYLKMRLPSSLMPSPGQETEERLSKGFSNTQKILKEFELKKNRVNDNADCSKAKDIFDSVIGDTEYDVWLDGTMVGYEKFLNKDSGFDSFKARLGFRLLNLFSIESSFAQYEFPHMSTVDQSMYIDQAMALVGLGYKQAELLQENIVIEE